MGSVGAHRDQLGDGVEAAEPVRARPGPAGRAAPLPGHRVAATGRGRLHAREETLRLIH